MAINVKTDVLPEPHKEIRLLIYEAVEFLKAMDLPSCTSKLQEIVDVCTTNGWEQDKEVAEGFLQYVNELKKEFSTLVN